MLRNHVAFALARPGAAPVLGLVLLLALVGLVYWPSLEAPFHLDDTPNIAGNPHVRLDELSWEALARAAFDSPLPQRALVNVSFALNYYFGGYEVAGYHAVNVVIHLLNGLLLFGLVRVTLELAGAGARTRPQQALVFACVLLWLVHPLHVQSVTYVVQRMNSLAALFYLLALLLYVRGRLAPRAWPWFAGSALAWLLALGSKEIAATLPAFILLYEWYFFRDLDRAWLRRGLPWLGAALAGAGGVLLYTGGAPLESLLSGYEIRDFTLAERLLTQGRVVVFYLSLLLYPHPDRLNLDHDFALSHSLLDPPSTLLCLAAIAGLLIVAIGTARRHRLLSFCILWFFGQLAIESSILPLEMVFEHRTYLPSMGLCLLAAALLLQVRWSRRMLAAGLCGLGVVWSFWTYERNVLWSDGPAFWRDAAAKSPNKARPLNNLGLALYNQARQADDPDRLEQALAALSQAVQAYSRYRERAGAVSPAEIRTVQAVVHMNRGAVLLTKGDWRRAQQEFSRAIALDPDAVRAYNSRGVIRQMQGDLAGAFADFDRAIALDPDAAEAYVNRGTVRYLQHDLEGAVTDYTRAMQLDPRGFLAPANRGLARLRRGDLVGALDDLDRALQLNPRYAEGYLHRGDLQRRRGRLDAAVADFEKALQLDPYNPSFYQALGLAFQQMGRPQQAAEALAQALAAAPAGWPQRPALERRLHALSAALSAPRAP